MAIYRTNHLLRRLVSVSLGSFLYFPVWWYSRGLRKTVLGIGEFLSNRSAAIGLRFWVKNLFRPMYGVRDWQGRIISFIMRLVVIAWYLLLMVVFGVLSLAVLAAYLLILPLVFFMLWYQLTGRSWS